jgi:hypothetical protein
MVFGTVANTGMHSVVSRMTKWETSQGLSNFGAQEVFEVDFTGTTSPWFEIEGKVNVLSITTDITGATYFALRYMDTLVVADSVLGASAAWSPEELILCWQNGILWTKPVAALQALAFDAFHSELVGLTQKFGGSSLVRFNPSAGSLIDSTFLENALCAHFDLDPLGNAYVAGIASGGDSIHAGTFSQYTGSSGMNVFALKVGRDGNGRWMQSAEDMNYAFPHILCDHNSNIWMTGDLFGSQVWGTDTLAGSQWVYDFFLTKFDSSGAILGAWETPNTSTLTGDYRIAQRQPLAPSDSGVVLMLSNRGGVPFNGALPVGGSTNPQDHGLTFLEFGDDYQHGETFSAKGGSVLASGLGTVFNGSIGIWGAGIYYADTLQFNTHVQPLDSLNNDVIGGIITGPFGNVEEPNQTDSFVLYPNPVSDKLFSTYGWQRGDDLHVYNSLGSLIYEGSPELFSAIHLPEGMYYLIVNDQRRVFVVRHE